MAKRKSTRTVETLTHEEASRRNIPTAEHEPVMADDDRSPVEVAYERRNRDLDPQLVWRGKDEQNWSDLVVQAPPLFIQEKVHPKALINDLLRHSKTAEAEKLARESGFQVDLFADFNGLPSEDARTEFYQHDANWSNRMILGDSLQVMASLAEREGLRGKVQCIYLDPPYGIGQQKEAEITDSTPPGTPTQENVRLGFVYERVPHITLKSIANNAEIDVIWERWQETLEPLRAELNDALGRTREEWEILREPGDPWPEAAASAWNKLGAAETGQAKEAALRTLNRALNRHYTLDNVPDSPRDPWEPTATDLHTRWWEARIARQREIDASIAAKAEFEYLYDKPYEDRRKVRVAGPFTVESISPHRVLDVDENDELIDNVAEARLGYGETQDFANVILEHLRTSGVQQAHKEDRIAFSSITPWPGELICAEGRYVEGGDEAGAEKRAGVFIGPEFGTVARPDLVTAAREAADVGFDVLVACAFNYEAHASEFRKLGRIPILKARMNADLHMAGDLKNTGKGNLFVIFGEPDIDVLPVEGDGTDQNPGIHLYTCERCRPEAGGARGRGVQRGEGAAAPAGYASAGEGG